MNKQLITDVTDYKKINVELFRLSDEYSLRFVVDLYTSDGFSLKGYYSNIYMRNNWNLILQRLVSVLGLTIYNSLIF